MHPSTTPPILVRPFGGDCNSEWLLCRYAVKGDGPPVKDFDLSASVVGALKPVVKTVPITVPNRTFEVEFTPQVENLQINAIEILSGR